MAHGVASTRMYNATPAVAEAWQRLFVQVFADLDWPVRVIPHAWPASLKALWQRRDLVCGFMCGLPFAEHVEPVVPRVAPVPAAEAYGGLPRYRSELLVRRECGWRSLPDTFGQRFGWMVPHSQSGYQAARLLLAPYAGESGSALYSASVGPLDTPPRVLEALQGRQIDVTALDSYFLELVRKHEPAWLAGVDTIAVTPWTPIPLLVAAQTLPAPDRERLVDKLCSLHEDARYAGLLDAVVVQRFVVPDVPAYDSLPLAAAGETQYPEIR